MHQAHWMDEVRNTMADKGNVQAEALRKLLECGITLAPHPAVERTMAELQELLSLSDRWEEKARICLQARLALTVDLSKLIKVQSSFSFIRVILS